MIVKRIENTSDHDISVLHEDGARQVLKPGHVTVNVKLENLDEIKNDAKVTHDLTEVTGG